MSENERRKALNEVVFREVNEKIVELHSSFTAAGRAALDIVCECDRMDCVEQISVAVEKYEKIRGDATLFFVVPGHEDDSIEEAVERRSNYTVVRKRPVLPREIAEQTDPRSA